MFKCMDNPSFRKDGDRKKNEKGIELSVSSTNGGASTATENLVTTCTPEVCRTARQRYPPPDLAGSPWHLRKTIYFVGLIVLLIIWIIIFGTLSHLKLL